MLSFTILISLIVDSRYGRNIVRTLLEYYRFTNVLSIPLASELKSKKHRPKTHRSRSRVRRKHIVEPRPKTSREYAPITYTELELLRENSLTSNDGSPTRSGFGSRVNKNIYLNLNAEHQRPDQYSLLSIQASKFHNLDFSETKTGNKQPKMETRKFPVDVVTITVPPKPSLTIIDFNQLTRGGLEKAKRSESRTRQP